MNYTLYTLVDITETGEHHGPDEKSVNQQANYNTVIQVLGLRANPAPIKTISHHESVKDIEFGSRFRCVQRYWQFEFEIEYGAPPLEDILDDFDLVPVIDGLDETVKLAPAIFSSKDPKNKNTVILSDNDQPDLE